jgi:L-alanine-DL-glutamate epimerase-like enolase superfamily enzyme
LRTPLRISGRTFENVNTLRVNLQYGRYVGQGEATGVYYRNETAESMFSEIERLRSRVEDGTTRELLRELLPPGGARNALDCALWDLEAKVTGRAVWEIAGLHEPRPLLTTFTCGADSPERMATAARAYGDAQAIKLKLTGEAVDTDRVMAVREARPEVWLGVDANQSFTRKSLERFLPVLVAAGVALIEQPCPVGQEAWLDGLSSPIPIAADESVQSTADLQRVAARVEVVNIKLDKCGGLTEALEMARCARKLGLETMVGNMFGTSLAMAPAVLVGQLCDIVDLDGPVFLKADRIETVRYHQGMIVCPNTIWGWKV